MRRRHPSEEPGHIAQMERLFFYGKFSTMDEADWLRNEISICQNGLRTSRSGVQASPVTGKPLLASVAGHLNFQGVESPETVDAVGFQPTASILSAKVGSGRRIRTLTYGVRVRCATFTQSRCVHNEQSLLYTSAAICQEQVFKIPINFSSLHACPLNPASAGAEGTDSAAAAYCCTAASSEADVAAARSCACWRSSIWVAVSWDASRSEISASRM